MDEFQTVKMFYPDTYRKDLAIAGRNPDDFIWFKYGARIYDNDKNLYYFKVDRTMQFYEEKTGITYNVKNENRLLILSDSYNRKVLCNKYEILCQCSSNRNILSNECKIVRSEKTIKCVMGIINLLGYDGVVIIHDPIKKKLNCYDNPVCQNATFYFLNQSPTLLPLEKTESCFIVTYSKMNNDCIRSEFSSFPDIDDIDEMVQNQNCKETSKILYGLLNDYVRQKSLG